MAAKFDIYAHVTDTIIAALEAEVMPWQKPWKTGALSMPVNSHGRAYNGINVLILWATAARMGYDDPRWFTFKQAKAHGGCVRKGEKSTRVMLWRPISITETDDATGEERAKKILVARSYCVFNAAQIEGLQTPEPCDRAANLDHVEQVITDTGADVRHGGGRAFYHRGEDYIRLPHREAFDSVEGYYSTALHELTHWTGGDDRLARDFGARFGDDAYAFEELVAEIGSAFLCARLGVAGERCQHASYVDNWLRVLKGDKRAIVTAAAAARRAVEFVLGEAREGEARAAA